jgi:hypothetical protein
VKKTFVTEKKCVVLLLLCEILKMRTQSKRMGVFVRWCFYDAWPFQKYGENQRICALHESRPDE